MAERPVFIPSDSSHELVHIETISFTWHPGFAVSQAQKSIRSLHEAAHEKVDGDILEISSKSPSELGVALSAFNLSLIGNEGQQLTVETAFQGSKVFEGGQQYTDLYDKTSREAKKDARLKQSGRLVAFRFEGYDWPLDPKTAFYDWLYLRALNQNPDLAHPLLDYAAFTDIMFNPKKSINCQARSAALYVALSMRGKLEEALAENDRYLHLVEPPTGPVQGRLVA